MCNGCPEVEPPSLEYAAQTLPLVQLATMRTAGFIGLRPLAKGAYMRTRDKFIAQERHYKEAAKAIEDYWNMYCRRQAGKAELNLRRLHFRAFEHKSATLIQSIWRMYYYGKLGIVRRKEELRLEHEQLVKAVCMVQRHYRGHLGYFKYLGRKRQVKRQNQASIEIQRLVRGHLGRMKSETYRNEMVEACIKGATFLSKSFKSYTFNFGERSAPFPGRG